MYSLYLLFCMAYALHKMTLRLFDLIKRWTCLCVFGISFASCIRGENTDLLDLPNELLKQLDDISLCITARKTVPVIDNNGNTIFREEPCRENFPKARKLFRDVQESLGQWLVKTRYPIPATVLTQVRGKLIELQKDIDDLPDGRDKNQFRKAWGQLNQTVDALIPKKDVLQNATVDPNATTDLIPAGQ